MTVPMAAAPPTMATKTTARVTVLIRKNITRNSRSQDHPSAGLGARFASP